MLPPIDRLNAFDEASCAAALGRLFENAPVFTARLCTARPFDTYGQMIEAAQQLAADLPTAAQDELIDGHPRIGADPATVSAISFREQGYDAAPPVDDSDLGAHLARLNDEYEARFGFRFVVFVNGRSRGEIAEAMTARMGEDREVERQRALTDVFAIARSRLARLEGEEGR